MLYIQYYDYDLSGELSEVLGDRGVVILDGRMSLPSAYAEAVNFNGFRRPHYPAYRLMRGPSFTRSEPICKLIEV